MTAKTVTGIKPSWNLNVWLDFQDEMLKWGYTGQSTRRWMLETVVTEEMRTEYCNEKYQKVDFEQQIGTYCCEKINSELIHVEVEGWLPDQRCTKLVCPHFFKQRHTRRGASNIGRGDTGG
ncbi:hypothetical protein AGABI1DRAFT_91101 [Agaricus bisporus var. burnettii JB137-S8]|uniref:Uncharacterized protein n=1 Tax=Agaricus bisporus var. burnettii (strain JB137-S8 / ATCC MYA-4627 / FGSC 10392) TaxID=597362 RepID=K5W3M1_AGABU|nr:uncharacterized protein AGABI1DRAFT_91101 [Agaricus bisporus var. burnettii JB137-S8]EKM81394.1 hypothetical protein AGABI1DRAFT_91101 [Agaricus bisporus var. burnettii JB137-S8]